MQFGELFEFHSAKFFRIWHIVESDCFILLVAVETHKACTVYVSRSSYPVKNTPTQTLLYSCIMTFEWPFWNPDIVSI